MRGDCLLWRDLIEFWRTCPARAQELFPVIRKSSGGLCPRISLSCKAASSRSFGPLWLTLPREVASFIPLVLWNEKKTKRSSNALWRKAHGFEYSTAATSSISLNKQAN